MADSETVYDVTYFGGPGGAEASRVGLYRSADGAARAILRHPGARALGLPDVARWEGGGDRPPFLHQVSGTWHIVGPVDGAHFSLYIERLEA